MKIGILVVYYVADGDESLLDLHLHKIAAHSRTVPYTIYAAANRLQPHFRERIASEPNLKICTLPDTELRSSWEHSFYLDALAREAISDGATHLCTLDVDSFPIRDGWIETLLERIAEGNVLAAASRREDGETMLPHPSCLFMPAEFVTRYSPTFFPDKDAIQAPAFQAFLHETRQMPDSGIGYGYILYTEDLAWARLYRTNKVDDHFLLAGIYGDVVFHLGSASRDDRLFHSRGTVGLGYRVADFIERRIMYCPPGSTRKALVDLLTNRAKERYAERQKQTYETIRERLLREPDDYIAYLRGVG